MAGVPCSLCPAVAAAAVLCCSAVRLGWCGTSGGRAGEARAAGTARRPRQSDWCEPRPAQLTELRPPAAVRCTTLQPRRQLATPAPPLPRCLSGHIVSAVTICRLATLSPCWPGCCSCEILILLETEAHLAVRPNHSQCNATTVLVAADCVNLVLCVHRSAYPNNHTGN